MLWKKMLRDLLNNKGSYLACLTLTLIGLVVFTAFSILADNVTLSQEKFYREQNFAHGFVSLESMPQGNLERLSKIEGIRDISGRVVKEVRVYDPGRDESVYLLLVSLDPADPRRVNDVLFLEGEQLVAGELKVWIDNQFFAANGLKLYQELEIIAGGSLKKLTLAGVGMSSEFTYPLRDQKELYPNPEQFGIAFLSLEDMAALFPETRGRVNDLVFTLEPGADFDRVKERLKPELEKYGWKTIYPREDQLSHLILNAEITQIGNMSRALPMLFLLIAGIILYIMLKRLVEEQRGQIGILKAFGYTDAEVITHYLSYALVVGSIGGIAGGVLGMLLANPLTKLLMEFFNMPEVYEGFSLDYLLAGLLLAVAVFLLAGYYGSKYALKLKPAEAMRPPAPTFVRKTFLEQVAFFWEMLTIQGKMAIRNLSRNRGRTVFLFLGMMLSCAVVALTWSLNDLVDKMIFYQYEKVETYDAKMTLSAPVGRKAAARELERFAPVSSAEPIIELPATLSRGWLAEDILLLGIPQGGRLYNILDVDGQRVVPAAEGLFLSKRLADKLGVSAGSSITLGSPLFGHEDERKEIQVVGVIPQDLGMNAYIELTGLEEILNQGELATSFLLKFTGEAGEETGSSGIVALRELYRESDLVAGVDGREERLKQTRELMETFGSAIYLYVFIGVIIGFSIIYSSSFIILSERSRELASMMVLGMSPHEVLAVITFEQWFISILAMIAGIPLAQALLWGLSLEMSTDLYTIPGDLSSQSLFMAPLITAASIWLAQRFVLRKIEKLSLIDVLKTRE